MNAVMKRLQNISIMRVTAMLLIVYYHCLCCYGVWKGDYASGLSVDFYVYLCRVLNDYHVPTFAFLSGYLFGYQRFNGGGYVNTKIFIWKKCLRVLVPYILVGLFLCILQNRPLISMVNGIAHLWFLLSIFECYVVFRLVDFLYKRNWCISIIFLSYSVLFIYKIHPVGGVHISNFVWLASYYSVGMALSRLKDKNWFSNRSLLGYLLLASLFLHAVEILVFYKRPISLVLGLNVIVLSFLWLGTFKDDFIRPWVIKLDAASMGIYILQQILIQEINSLSFLRNFIVEYYYIYPHLLFIVVLSLSYYIVIFLKQYSWSKYIIG